jgi:hypothetical protein
MTAIDSTAALRLAVQASRAEQFALWAIRLWWSRFPELDAVWPKLAQGFRAFGMPAALESLHGFCSIALVVAAQTPAIACARCSSIHPDEERLLQMLCLAARGETVLAQRQLLSTLPAASAQLAIRHAERFAQLLIVAGLEWPRVDEPDGESLSSNAASRAHASSRLH